MSKRDLSIAMAAALATLALPIDQELVVDLFAGGGGASAGIAEAYREPDVAVNHSIAAITAHEANHPTTLHFRSDVWEVDPVAATGGRPVGLLWASPDCRHFSKAKGSAPVSDSVRSLADVVVKWARAVLPRLVILENVEEFTTWGPLLADGRPCPISKGLSFKRWVRDLEYLGYVVEFRELRACDYGTPTIRKRLFVIARRDGQPIVWPQPTHGRPDDPRVLAGDLRPYRTAAECIDWSIPVCSIFATRDEAKAWAKHHGVHAPLRPLERNTLRRVVKGVVRHVADSPKPFIVPLRGTSAAHMSTHGIDTPASTVSASGKHHALAVPFVAPNNNNNVPRAGDTPAPTVTGTGRNMFVEPVLVSTSHSTTTGRGPNAWSADEPVRTIDGSGGGFAVLAPSLMHITHSGERAGGAAGSPVHTVTAANRGELAIVAPVLIEAAHADESPSGTKRWGSGVKDLDAPLGTVHAGGGNFALASAALIGVGGRAGQSDPRAVDAPYHTTTSKADSAIVVAHIAKFRGDSVGTAATEPLPTITAGGNMARPAGAAHALGVVSACFEQANGGFYEGDGRAADAPLSTVTGSGTQQRLVAAHLIQYYSSGGQTASVDTPSRTIPTKGRVAVVESVQIRANALTPEQWNTARAAAALMREFAPERFPVADGEALPEIVMLGDYILVDIGLRMLKPRELARAQGFADSYVLDPFVTVTDKRGRTKHRRLTGTEQVKLIGNSVCPQVAAALVSANLQSLIRLYQRQARAA